MSITSDANSTFLEVDNAHLRVSGDIHATSVKVGAIEILPGYSLESTTVIGNTTSQTIQFTNTETSLVTSGDINMLHSSNNAAIKLNSNVVTEFPRSKKLIKYPRVALTSASQDGYVVSSTTNYYDSGNPLYPWQVFNSSTYRFQSARSDYSLTDGNYTGTVNQTNVDGNLVGGEWIQLQLPNKISLNRFTVALNLSTHGGRMGKSYTLAGSNDGSTWTTVSTHTQSYGNGADGSDFNHDVESTTMYTYYRLIATSTFAVEGPHGGSWALTYWKLFGIPEYDPDAAGVDVKVTSYPNVPNTDWLEVYYDAKNLADGAVTSVDDLTPSGTNDGTATNVTVSDGAFVFNGTSSLLEKTSLSIPGGDNPFTFSFWIKNDTFDATQYILRLGDNQTMYQNVNIYKTSSNQIVFTTWLLDFPINYTFTSNRWNHISLMYPGGGWEQSNLIVYVDGKRFNFGANRSSGGTGGNVMTLATSLTLRLGGFSTGNMHFDGSIANFRLFNRALTSDEVWQLYAYQKEYFGHGDLSMTLKAGRLNVRGDISCDGVVKPYTCAFAAYVASGGNSSTTGIFPADSVSFNIGNCYNTSTYEFTAPVHGIYHMSFSAFTNQDASTASRIFARKNDVTVGQVGATIEDHGNSLSLTVEMNGGDRFSFNGGSSTPIYYYGASAHNLFCGHLICAL
jgi:hypothetical protein